MKHARTRAQTLPNKFNPNQLTIDEVANEKLPLYFMKATAESWPASSRSAHGLSIELATAYDAADAAGRMSSVKPARHTQLTLKIITRSNKKTT